MKTRTNRSNYAMPCGICGKDIARGPDYVQGGERVTFTYSETASVTTNKFHQECKS